MNKLLSAMQRLIFDKSSMETDSLIISTLQIALEKTKDVYCSLPAILIIQEYVTHGHTNHSLLFND